PPGYLGPKGTPSIRPPAPSGTALLRRLLQRSDADAARQPEPSHTKGHEGDGDDHGVCEEPPLHALFAHLAGADEDEPHLGVLEEEREAAVFTGTERRQR